jgi:signal transduction histidine kinase/ligand-binding sensor domain-containing protein
VFAQELGNPFIQNFPANLYKAHPQNFSVVQDSRGILYFGNTDGVLEFDGVNWRLIKLPNDFTVRELAVDESDKIYVSGVGNFGYLKTDENGKLTYFSLSESLPIHEQKFRDVWEITIVEDNIYFRSNQKIYHVKGDKILNIWESKTKFSTLFHFDNQIFVAEDKIGFSILKGDSIILTCPLPSLKLQFVRFNSKKQNEVILASKNDGLFVLKKNHNSRYEFSSFSTQADDFFKLNEIYSGIALSEGNLLATNGGGLALIDDEGKIIRYFSKNDGITNSTINDVVIDKQNGVWLATTNGISRIDFQSPFTYWNKENDLKGAVNVIIRHHNQLYIGTLGGLYKLVNGQILQIKNTSGIFFWNANEWSNPENNLDKKLLFGTTEGVFELKNDKLLPILKNNNCYKITYLRKYPEIILIGAVNGLFIGKFVNNQFEIINHITEILDIRSIVEDSNGVIWIRTFRQGVARIKFEDNQWNKYKISTYGKEAGLPSNRDNRPLFINNQLIFATEKGVFEFDETTQKFLPSNLLGTWHFDTNKEIFHIKEDKKQNLWISGANNQNSPIIYAKKNFDRDVKDNYIFQFEPFQQIPDMLLLNILVEENGIVWIGGSEGLFRYDSNIPFLSNNQYQSLIRKISINNDSVIYEGNFKYNSQNPLSITILYNSTLQIDYNATHYTELSSLKYKYVLSKSEDKNLYWSNWSKNNFKEFQNLWEGNYQFRVNAINVYEQESEEVIINIKILPPFYRTYLAYFLYLFLIIGIVASIIKYKSIRLENRNKRLQQIVDRKTSEIQEKNVQLEQQKEELRAQTETLKKFNEELLRKSNELKQQSEEIQAQRDSIVEQKDVLQRLNENISILSEIGQQITSTFDMREIVRKLYVNVNKIIKAEGFGIGIYNEKLNRIEIGDFIEKGVFLPNTYDDLHDDNRLSVVCFKQDKIFVINDIERDFEAIIGKKPLVKVGETPASVIYMPLKVANNAIGVITVQSFDKNAYSPQDVELLKNLASYISIALLNSKAFQEVNAQKEQLERARQVISHQNKRLRDTNTNLEEQVAQRTKELREAYQELDTFLYRSAHDLKGPVSRLLGLCYVAKLETTENVALDYLNRLEEATKNMESMIARLLRMHEVKVHIPNYQLFVLSDLIEEMLLDIPIPQFISLNIYYHSLENLHFKIDKLLFLSILKRLIENSVQFYDSSKTKSYIQLDFSQSSDEQLIVSVVDNGIGIPPEAAPKIFDMFYIGTNQSKGFGLGLYEASIIAKKLRAKIFLVESDNQHTEFAFVIPVEIY